MRAFHRCLNVAIALLLLVGCGSPGASNATDVTATGDATGSSAGSASAPTPASTTSATGASTTPIKPGGSCSIIGVPKASSLLGAAATGMGSTASSPDAVKIDGCVYTSAAGNLGYDVNDLTGSPITPAQTVAILKLSAASAPGATVFAVPSGDASIGFTMSVGANYMARVEVAVGVYDIALNAVNPSPDTARQVALAAAALLAAAVA